MQSRKYPTFKEAITDLESKGKLKYWGRIGDMGLICLYDITLFDGRKFDLNVYYDTGLVEIRK